MISKLSTEETKYSLKALKKKVASQNQLKLQRNMFVIRILKKG